MSEHPIPAPQYTLIEAIGICLAMCERCIAEVRALSLLPGPPGEKGDRGEKGTAGPIGERGPAGAPGRNAADLALLQQGIDERIEAYFKAATVTTADGGRTLVLTIGGVSHEIKTAIPLDVGVWTERAFMAGDAVSHGGSLFIAQTETSAKPGKSDEWRLAVKRGNDGRDGRAEDKRQPDPVRFK